MEIYKNYLRDFVQFHVNLHANYTKQLSNLPKGKLIGRKYKSNYQYYQFQSIVFTPETIINKMSDVYKSLPNHYFIDKSIMDEELQQWMNAPFDQSTYKLEEKIHTTSRDLKVRTKSELIIAEILYMYNIAFRYEQRLYIRDKRFAPDFTIQLPDGRIFYWEHVGLTNSFGYMNDHYYKLKYYQYKNIVPWKNLILTYDNEAGQLNTQIIHSEIKNKLLPHF